jgi:predicted nucleotidyltransferase
MDNKYAEICKKTLPILRPYIRRMAVFGSLARGEEQANSDVDLLITLKPSGSRPKLGLFKLMSIEEKLREALGREVDLVTEDNLSPYIRPYVEKDLVILYEER